MPTENEVEDCTNVGFSYSQRQNTVSAPACHVESSGRADIAYLSTTGKLNTGDNMFAKHQAIRSWCIARVRIQRWLPHQSSHSCTGCSQRWQDHFAFWPDRDEFSAKEYLHNYYSSISAVLGHQSDYGGTRVVQTRVVNPALSFDVSVRTVGPCETFVRPACVMGCRKLNHRDHKFVDETAIADIPTLIPTLVVNGMVDSETLVECLTWIHLQVRVWWRAYVVSCRLLAFE